MTSFINKREFFFHIIFYYYYLEANKLYCGGCCSNSDEVTMKYLNSVAETNGSLFIFVYNIEFIIIIMLLFILIHDRNTAN